MIWQPRRGFRYGAEAFWLAGFALEGGPMRSAIDLGTGSGIVAALLAGAGVDAVGIDVRPEWGPAWERTLAQSTPSGRLRLTYADARGADLPAVDVAVANPPFFPAGTGPTSPDPVKRAARTEASATLADFVEAALGCAPRACFVVPREREGEVTHPTAGVARIARVGRRRVLVELRHGWTDPPTIDELGEGDPRAIAWYEAVRRR